MGRINFLHEKGVLPDNSLGAVVALPGAFDAVVIHLSWRQLQPTPDRVNFTAADSALALVRAYNTAHPAAPLGVVLRVVAAMNAPDWAKSLAGGPVMVRDNKEHGGQEVSIGRFWSEPYRNAWRKLQTNLAARYDGDPVVREVSVTSCASRGGEPFILPLDADFSVRNLRGAGFSDAAYKACLVGAIDDYSAWKRTQLNYNFSPFHSTDVGNRADTPFTILVMDKWRARMGARGTIMNTGLDVPLRPGLQPIYDEMRRLGGNIDLQMVSPKTSYWPAAIDYAASMGATVVELWTPSANGNIRGFASFPATTLGSWSRKLRANAIKR